MVYLVPNKAEIWKYLSHMLTLINSYQNDFRENNNNLIEKEEQIRVLIRKEKIDNLDLDELELFCKIEWKKLIIKAINEIKTEINSRKTKGIAFSDISFQLEKIDEDLIDINDYKLEWFENTYCSDIKPLRQDAKERMDIENFTSKQRRNNYISNFVIAFVFFLLGFYLRSG